MRWDCIKNEYISFHTESLFSNVKWPEMSLTVGMTTNERRRKGSRIRTGPMIVRYLKCPLNNFSLDKKSRTIILRVGEEKCLLTRALGFGCKCCSARLYMQLKPGVVDVLLTFHHLRNPKSHCWFVCHDWRKAYLTKQTRKKTMTCAHFHGVNTCVTKDLEQAGEDWWIALKHLRKPWINQT